MTINQAFYIYTLYTLKKLIYSTKVSSTPSAVTRLRFAHHGKKEVPLMKTRLLSALTLLALLGAAPGFAFESSCVDCHGNVETMKAMVPKPVVHAEEGEG
jgi:hypothetical protein